MGVGKFVLSDDSEKFFVYEDPETSHVGTMRSDTASILSYETMQLVVENMDRAAANVTGLLRAIRIN